MNFHTFSQWNWITFGAVALGTAFIVLVAVLIAAGSVQGGRAVLVGLVLGLALQLLHLGPLVLEPHLNHSHRQARVFGQRLPHLPARLGADFERGLKLPPLRRCQYRPRPFRSSSTVVPRPAVVIQRWIVTWKNHPNLNISQHLSTSNNIFLSPYSNIQFTVVKLTPKIPENPGESWKMPRISVLLQVSIQHLFNWREINSTIP